MNGVIVGLSIFGLLIIFALCVGFYQMLLYPKGYPKTIILDYTKLYEIFWQLNAQTGKTYFVPRGLLSKPKLKVRNWDISLFSAQDSNFRQGDYIIYPNREGLYLVFVVLQYNADDTIQTLCIGVIDEKKAFINYTV